MSLTKVTYSMIDGAPTNVLDFGADPTGVADSTAAINAALAASDAVYFPPGTYLTDGNHNIKNKCVFGVSKDVSIIKLSGSNTNASLFINGANILTPWGDGDGCIIENLKLEGNWDLTTPNAETNISNIGALVKWWAGGYVQIRNSYFYKSYGFGIFSYQLGYSYINECYVASNGKNNIHLEAPSGALAITSTTINGTSIGTCGGSGTTGGNGIYIKNGFYCDINGCIVEGPDVGLRIDGNDNRSITVFETHFESTTTANIYYVGAGTDLMLLQNIFATAPRFVQTNPSVQTYVAIGNYLLEDVYALPYVRSNATQVLVNNASPKTTINSIALTPGTWVINAAVIGAASSGAGQASARQEFAINGTPAIPSYGSSFADSLVRGDCASTVNTADGFMACNLTLTVTITSDTTFYLYGGFQTITSTLEIAMAGWVSATKVNGAYP